MKSQPNKARIRLWTLAVALLTALLSTGWEPRAAEKPVGDAKKPPAADENKADWKKLFDGKSLAGWKSTNFGGEGKVSVEDGTIVMEQGAQMTGITYARDDFPRKDYE